MWPTFTQSFVNDVWLSAIDTLALGTMVLIIGYLINLRLDAIRDREAVRKALFERRMNAILEQWDAIRYLHFDTVDAWLESVTYGESSGAGDVKGSPPLDGTDDPESLVRRAHRLTHAIRDRRRLLGKRVADAMYAAVGADLQAARTVAAGQVQANSYENASFEWLEQVLDIPDVEEFPLPGDKKTRADAPAGFFPWTKTTRQEKKAGGAAASAPMG
jgi:hypothetical protein